MAKSSLAGFVAGFLGLGLALIGLVILLVGAGLGAISLLGIGSAQIGIITIISGIGAIFLGMRLYFENETPVLKFILAIVGLIIFTIGVIVALTSEVTLGLSLFVSILLWAMGIAFIQYGTGIKIIPVVNSLVTVSKKLTVGDKK